MPPRATPAQRACPSPAGLGGSLGLEKRPGVTSADRLRGESEVSADRRGLKAEGRAGPLETQDTGRDAMKAGIRPTIRDIRGICGICGICGQLLA